ncbi:AAA family ATPase [Azospirillum argentinense]
MTSTLDINDARRMRQGGPSGPRGTPPLKVIDPIRRQGQELPERRWIVEGVVPAQAVTMVSGDGGLGKSLLAMQLSTACATGKEWLGLPTAACRVLGVHCEDTNEELHIRQHYINQHYGVEFGDLEHLRLISRVGEDNVLLETDKFGKSTGRTTAFYDQILTCAKDFGAQLVILDSLHDLFGGNENIRSEARHFVGQLRRVALETDGAVVLLSHPSASGLSSGTGTSGSTAWNAAVRSRLYLTRPPTDEDADPDARVLRGMKNNYGKVGDEIALRWEDGVFVRTDRPKGGTVERIEKRAVEAVFLECMAAVATQGRPATDAYNSPRYAPKLFASMPEGQGYRRKEFERAMAALFSAGRIKKATVPGPDRHPMVALVEVEQ